MTKGSVQQDDINIIDIYAQNGSPTCVKKNTNRIKRGKRMRSVRFRRLQHTTHSKGQINQTGNKERGRGSEQHIRTDEPNEHLQNTPSKSNRIHVLRTCTRSISSIDHTLGYQKSLSKHEKTGIVLSGSQRYETRNKLLKQSEKEHKHMEA